MKVLVAASSWGATVSKVEMRAREIRDTHVGQTTKRVLLVEGPEDVAAFRQMLNRQSAGWESKWALAESGSKKQALEIAALESAWLVLVDRDEWTANEVRDFQQRQANLIVLPRFCLESYLIDPAELWLGLPAKQQQKFRAECPRLRRNCWRLLPIGAATPRFGM